MRFCTMVFLLILLFVEPARADVSWAGISLAPATLSEQEANLDPILSVTPLNTIDDLTIGDIVFVDVVDTTLLIAVEYHDNVTQLWVWDILAGFERGYEIVLSYPLIRAIYRSFCLSPDGTILYYVGKGGAILGLSGSNEDIEMTVYSKPLHFEEYSRPSRSEYQCISHRDGSVIVSTPTGESFTVFDFSPEYSEYRANYNSKLLPFTLLYIAILILFLLLIAWLIRNNISRSPRIKH